MIHLKSQLFSALAQGGKEAIMLALQQAIELEHSTIPLYLYTLYSLDASKNPEIAQIIKSVSIEEMLHLTLAANVLNAIGGSPVLDTPDFIPTYPGPLPGGVDAGTKYHLSPFTMTQLDAFLDIEQPEKPLDIHTKKLTAAAPNDDEPITIGQFYDQIIAQLKTLPASAFYASPRNQIGPDQMDHCVVVTDLASAIEAITVIIDQGEGTSTTPKEIFGTDWAHYYRYQQIQKGFKLVAAPGQKPPFSFSGDPIKLDTSGVYPVPVDPSAKNYTPAQVIANNTFNYTYTSLLKSLHDTLNGQPERLDTAIGLMMSLKQLAKGMMSGGADGKTFTGPTFEYQPTLLS
jgi:Ferritin-like